MPRGAAPVAAHLDGDRTARWFLPALVTPGEIRECRQGEAACRCVRDPGPQAP